MAIAVNILKKMKRLILGYKIRKTLRGSSRGMTLIEVVVALALFAIIAIAFAGGLGTASRAVLTADIRTNAESLARTQMEYVKNQEYEEAPPGGVATYNKTTDIPYGYTIWSINGTIEVNSIVGIPWDSGNNTAVNEDNGLQKITLVIKHEGTYVITLEGYKVDREE
jgi:prepilin-type N-terminal cleavage/methylation domain-containing protein